MSRIETAVVDHVRDATDLLGLIGRYVELRKEGKEYVGLCPFHAEKTPSFKVNPRKGFFHCFGCGEHGGAIDFVMLHMGMGFGDAVRALARDANIVIPEGPQQSAAGRRRGQPNLPPRTVLPPPPAKDEAVPVFTEVQKDDMRATMQVAQAFFAEQLARDGGGDARQYLRDRGLNDEVLDRFALGYAPTARDALWLAMPQSLRDAAVRSGLVLAFDEQREAIDPMDFDDATAASCPSERLDRFRGRVTLPIRDMQGRILGFGSRAFKESSAGKGKYINTPSTGIFSKGSMLYGAFEAAEPIRQAQSVVVVEGYLDVIALAQAGLDNTVATMGTACTSDQVRHLFDMAPDVVFCFDGDNAGRMAADRAAQTCLSMIDDEHAVRFVFLPDGEDPDSWVRQVGADTFRQSCAEAVPLDEVLLKSLRSDLDLARSPGREALRERARQILDRMQPCEVRQRLERAVGDLTGDRLPTKTQKGVPHAPRPATAKARFSPAIEEKTDPLWLTHAMSAVKIAAQHPGLAHRYAVADTVFRLVETMVCAHEREGSAPPGGLAEFEQSLRGLPEAAEASQGAWTTEDEENLRGALRQSELAVLQRASDVLAKQTHLDAGSLAEVRSFAQRRSELLTEHVAGPVF